MAQRVAVQQQRSSSGRAQHIVPRAKQDGGGNGATDGSSSSGSALGTAAGLLGGAALLLGGGYAFREPIRDFLTTFTATVDDLGALGPVAFGAVYAGLAVRRGGRRSLALSTRVSAYLCAGSRRRRTPVKNNTQRHHPLVLSPPSLSF